MLLKEGLEVAPRRAKLYGSHRFYVILCFQETICSVNSKAQVHL